MFARDAAVMALSEAVKFESDGRDFYLRAAAAAQNPLAKAVLEALAEDEKEHAARVREIFEELKANPGWPSEATMVARSSGRLDSFQNAAAETSEVLTPDADADGALSLALEMERLGLVFYRDRVTRASCPGEEAFFRRLVAEEEVHLRTIEKVREALRS